MIDPHDAQTLLQQLTRELENFEDIAAYLLPQPGDRPTIDGFEVCGNTLALRGVVGGDHLIYVDFKQRFDLSARIADATAEGRLDVVANLQRCQRMAGMALVDVSGHRITDALMAAMFHQAFLLGAIYELDRFGQITKRLFENLNTRFYQSSGAHKFVSLIYGEITEDARFRFLSAGQPFPAVFSHVHDRFMDVSRDLCISFPPLGLVPSLDVVDHRTVGSPLGFKDQYEMNEWLLMGAGDILLLHTDGLAEHCRGLEPYFPDRLEQVLRQVKSQSAAEIFEAIMADLLAFAAPTDDIGMIVVKRS